MRQQETREMLRTVCRQLQMQANAFGMLGEHIPELPPGADYVGVESFPLPQYAQLQINVMAGDREGAVEVLKLFPPRPLLVSHQAPYFRPFEAVGLAELHGMRMGKIYPVIFSSFMFPPDKEMEQANITQWSSRIGWYSTPVPGNPMRAYVTCNILNDPSRVQPDREENMPRGAIVVPDRTIQAESGIRVVHGYWDKDYQNWEADFLSGPAEDADWPTELEVVQ